MGKVETEFLKKCFAPNPQRNGFVCMLGSNNPACNYIYAKTVFHAGDLKKHALCKHKEEYHLKLENYIESTKQNENVFKKFVKQNQHNTHIKKTIELKLSKQEFLDSMLSIVTESGRPFSLYNDVGFRKILTPIYNAFNLTINRNNITSYIKKEANIYREAMKTTLKGKLLSLKFDTTSRNFYNFLSINCQYYENTINVCHLNMIVIKNGTTSEELKKTILSTLNQFDINLSNIVSATVDNGKNMIRTIKNLNVVLQEELEENNDDDNEVNNESTEYLESMIQSNFVYSEISTIRCAAHTLQLAIQDFFKELDLDLSPVRRIVCMLRNQQYIKIIRERNYAVPPLENITRWGSFYAMLIGFLNLGPLIKDLDTHMMNFLFPLEFGTISNSLKKLSKLHIKLRLFYKMNS